MFNFLIQNIILIASIVFFFLLGRHYAIIKRERISNDVDDIFEDVKVYVNDKINPPRSRILSPSKKKAVDLKDLEDTSI